MKYPQCYIFLKEKPKLPALSILEAWFGPKSEVYLQGASTLNKTLENRIDILQHLHRMAFKKSDFQMQCVAFTGTSVSTFFLTAFGENVLKVYWIDSAEHAKAIKFLSKQIENTFEFRCLIDLIERTYRSMSDYIYVKTGKGLVGDADIHRFFVGRNWGFLSEAEIHISQIAKNETRAGILRRIDLEGTIEEASG
jgi:hypothetical protein